MDEDPDLGDRRLLLRDDAEVELADHPGLRRVIRFDRVARVLDDRRRVAAEDGRSLLVRVEFGDAFRRDRLEGPDEEVGGRLALVGVEDGVPLVVEEVGPERAEDRIERGDNRVALDPAEDEAVLDLPGGHAGLTLGDEVVPGRRRRGEHVVPIGEGLEVADRRQGDQLGGLSLEALDPRAGARRPEAEVGERRRVVGVHLDVVRPEVLEDACRGVLRDPRVIHDVDVVLAGLRGPVLERLREERVVRFGQELHLRPGGGLEHRQDRPLEGGQCPVLERPDDELAAGLRCARAGRRGCGG